MSIRNAVPGLLVKQRGYGYDPVNRSGLLPHRRLNEISISSRVGPVG